MVNTPVSQSRVVSLASGRKLGVVEYGDPDGLPVLSLHGAPASRLMFDVAHGDAAKRGLRLIAFDRPGYGLSPLDYGTSLQGRTDTFAELPDALGLERFALLAVSGGGPYAVALAARLQARVTALALISPMGPVADVGAQLAEDPVHLSFSQRMFFVELPRHPWVLRANAEVAMRTFRAAPKLFASSCMHLLPEPDSEILSREEVAQSLIRMTTEATEHGILGAIADLEICSEPWNVDYSRIVAPSRLWLGEADTIVPQPVALRLGALIPNCEVTRIEGAGHFWVYDAIGDVLDCVLALAGRAKDAA